MTKISDETLSTYLDGELSAAQRQEVDNALSRDPAVSARLAQLTRADALVREYAAQIDEQPMPAAVLDLLQADGANNCESNVVSLTGWRQRRQQLTAGLQRYAAQAACMALAVGLAAGYLLGNNQTANTDTDAALFAALDTAPSGQSTALDNGQTLIVNFSFLDTQQQLCRQYSLEAPELRRDGIVCRQDEGWQTLAEMNLVQPDSAGSYQTATSMSGVDALLDSLMVEGPLSLDQERELLAR